MRLALSLWLEVRLEPRRALPAKVRRDAVATGDPDRRSGPASLLGACGPQTLDQRDRLAAP
jgi:hypothetical protein